MAGYSSGTWVSTTLHSYVSYRHVRLSSTPDSRCYMLHWTLSADGVTAYIFAVIHLSTAS